MHQPWSLDIWVRSSMAEHRSPKPKISVQIVSHLPKLPRMLISRVMRVKYLWLCVEADEYELPLAVADTAKQLAEMLGTSKSNVENCALSKDNGRISGRRFLKVVDDGE